MLSPPKGMYLIPIRRITLRSSALHGLRRVGNSLPTIVLQCSHRVGTVCPPYRAAPTTKSIIVPAADAKPTCIVSRTASRTGTQAIINTQAEILAQFILATDVVVGAGSITSCQHQLRHRCRV